MFCISRLTLRFILTKDWQSSALSQFCILSFQSILRLQSCSTLYFHKYSRFFLPRVLFPVFRVFRLSVHINFRKYSRFLRLMSWVALYASLSTRKCKCASTVAGDGGATSTRCGARGAAVPSQPSIIGKR